jgi:DNA topoisomerase-6 subunit A
MQTVAIASKCHQFISQNLHTTIRGLFYQLKYSLGDDVDENIFNEQAESNPLIEDLEASLMLKRENLNLNANRKGVLAGNLKIIDTFGGEKQQIDASKQGRSGWAIPSDVDNEIEFTDVKAKSVLVVEKDALWQRLNEDKLWQKENMILISPQGQAARGTRRLIRKFADMGLPVYVFNDGDAWGWYIYWTIKTGSMNLAYIGQEIATPEAKFLGVTMSDVEKYDFLKKMTMKATEVDLKRAQEMLDYPWINRHKEWVDELKKVLKTKTKLEQDTLQGPRLTFVDDYIKDKIKNQDFLP